MKKMRVRDLVNKLNEFDSNAEIVIVDCTEEHFNFIEEVKYNDTEDYVMLMMGFALPMIEKTFRLESDYS